MNILIIPPNDLINNALPNRLYHLARNWAQRHTLYLLRYPYYPTSINIERPLRRVDIITDVKPSSSPGTYYVRNAKAIYKALKRTLEKEPIDVIVHANILPSFFAVKLAKKLKVRTVFDYLDHYPESASAYYRNPLIKMLVYTLVFTLTKYNLRNSDSIVAVSYALKQIAEKHAKKNVHLIPNGVDTQHFKPLPKDFARRKLALESYEPILLYYGSITEWVDYEALLKVTAKLKSIYPNVLLLLVGKIYKSSEEMLIRQKVKQLGIENNVIIHPPQPQEVMPLYISASDVVIAPYKSLTKNFTTPVKVVESLACERPVVVPSIPEFKLWFKSYLEYYRTTEELIDKVLFILRSYDLFMQKLKVARKYVEENFDWNRLAQKYERILYSLF